MKRGSCAALAILFVLCVGNVALAQDDSTYIFGAYYVCDQNREGWSDIVTEQFIGPIYDRHVKEGHLVGWGRMAHNAGGEWRRLEYMVSNDLNTLLDTRDAIIEELLSDATEASQELTSMCPDHDDYIWQSVVGSQPLSAQLPERPAATYSTYFVCDVAKQERVDEIVEQAYAPVLNRLVQQGKLKAWSWFAHVLGGKYRRLLTYSADDHKTLIAAVDEYSQQVQNDNPSMSDEFSVICHSHTDYLWDNEISRP